MNNNHSLNMRAYSWHTRAYSGFTFFHGAALSSAVKQHVRAMSDAVRKGIDRVRLMYVRRAIMRASHARTRVLAAL